MRALNSSIRSTALRAGRAMSSGMVTSSVIVCSDHGNVEDLSTRGHTLNRVPVLYFGPTPREVLPRLRDVSDVGRVVLLLMGAQALHEVRT